MEPESAPSLEELIIRQIVIEQGIRCTLAEQISGYMMGFQVLSGARGVLPPPNQTLLKLFPDALSETLASFSSDPEVLLAFCSRIEAEAPGMIRLTPYNVEVIRLNVEENRPVLHFLGLGHNEGETDYLICYRIYSKAQGTRTTMAHFSRNNNGRFVLVSQYQYRSSS